MCLEGVTGLRGAVPPLGPAGRQIGIDPVHIEAVVIEVVGKREHGPGIVGGGDAQTGVGAAVHDEVGMHSQDAPVGINAGGELHVLAVAAPVGGQHLGPVVEHLHWPAGHAAEHRPGELEAGGLQFAAEAAADVCLDDAHVAHRKPELAGDVVLEVVRRLCARIDSEIIALPHGDGGVGLKGRLVGSLPQKGVCPHMIRFGKSLFHVAEVLVYLRIYIAGILIMELRRVSR